MAPQQMPRKGKQPECSPTSIFDLLTLDSPASSVATTPGALPLSPLPAAVNGSQCVQSSGQHEDSKAAATRRSPRQAATRKRGGALPPACRSTGAAAQPPHAAPTACVKHPWWHFRSAKSDAVPTTAVTAMATQPSGELPPLPRPPSFSRQASGSGRGRFLGALKGAAGLHGPQTAAAYRTAEVGGSGPPDPLEGHPVWGSRHPSHSSDASISGSAATAAADSSRGKDATAQQAASSEPLPMLRIDRTDSNTSSSSFSLWRSGSGTNPSDMQQV